MIYYRMLLCLIGCFISACHEPSGSQPTSSNSHENSQPVPPAECLSLIATGARSTKAGECSGPYYLSTPQLTLLGKNALVIDLSSVSKLPGQKPQKHATALFINTGISAQQKDQAQAALSQWITKSGHNKISFYLTYWTGKKSELIVGDLKVLIESVRQEFTLPTQRPIHVELEP